MEIYVARQPIFDKNKKIYGYELLFRDGMTNAFPDIDGDTATSKLLSDTFFNIGIKQISGKNISFINFTENLLINKIPSLFPKESIMVEILEDVEAKEDVVKACRELSEKGYLFALDDFIYNSDLQPLIDLASVIKFDFILTPINEIQEILDKLVFPHLNFLAEKIETYDEFSNALEMGFSYFQGYFFSKPEILTSSEIAPSKISLLQIINEINRKDFSFDRLEKFISSDVSISYKLLRYINSAYFKRLQEITSIKHALVFLGERETKQFISLVAIAGLSSDKPDELIRSSIIRARLCELIGKECNFPDTSELFLLGLLSHIDAMLDKGMGKIMEDLPISKKIKIALIDGEGELSDYIKLVSCYETGDWECCSLLTGKIGIAEEKLPQYYMDAIGWADALSSL